MKPEIWQAPRGKVHLVEPARSLPMCGGGGWSVYVNLYGDAEKNWIKIGDGFQRFFQEDYWWANERCKNCIREGGKW